MTTLAGDAVPGPATAPSQPQGTTPKVSVTVYVSMATWDESRAAAFPIVVEVYADSGSAYIGRKIDFVDLCDFDHGSLSRFFEKQRLPSSADRLFLTYELSEAGGHPRHLLMNGGVADRSLPLVDGSSFEKTILGADALGTADTLNLRAYLALAGGLVAWSQPISVHLVRGTQ